MTALSGFLKWFASLSVSQYIHQEFQFPLLDAALCRTESEHQVLNSSHILVSFTLVLLLFGTKSQYSRKRRQDVEEKQSDKAAVKDLVLTFCQTMYSIQQRKLKLFSAFHYQLRSSSRDSTTIRLIFVLTMNLKKKKKKKKKKTEKVLFLVIVLCFDLSFLHKIEN